MAWAALSRRWRVRLYRRITSVLREGGTWPKNLQVAAPESVGIVFGRSVQTSCTLGVWQGFAPQKRRACRTVVRERVGVMPSGTGTFGRQKWRRQPQPKWLKSRPVSVGATRLAGRLSTRPRVSVPGRLPHRRTANPHDGDAQVTDGSQSCHADEQAPRRHLPRRGACAVAGRRVCQRRAWSPSGGLQPNVFESVQLFSRI